MPILLEDADGMAHGNDWARGFMRGMRTRHDGWAELVNDEEHSGCLIPMMMLYHEHDQEMRPKPIRPRYPGGVLKAGKAGSDNPAVVLLSVLGSKPFQLSKLDLCGAIVPLAELRNVQLTLY